MKKSRKGFSTNDLLRTVVLILLYILLGNMNAIRANPIVPGAVVAVNMIIVVIGGILFGRYVGGLVGLFGTLINALTPAGNLFEFAAIIPHGIMGFTAGYLKERAGIIGSSLAILVGHVLNVVFFLVFGLLSFSVVLQPVFWYGLSYETIFGIVSISIICWIYLLIFRRR